MKTISDLIITFLLMFIGFISSHLSISLRYRLGCWIGGFFKFISPGRKKIAYGNLKIAFPYKNNDWYNSIVNKSYQNLGVIVSEVSALYSFTDDTIHKMIRYKNLELINKKHSEGKGLILLSGHFGNWELLAYSAGLFTNIPIHIIVKPQKNSAADRKINEYRIRSGNKLISMHKAAREIIMTIQNGGVIALLADQSATTDKDIFVDFFGIPSATYKAPAELALKYNIPVICSFPVRQNDHTYIAEIFELRHDDLIDDEQGIYEFTKRYSNLLENAVRENPELWVWQHRRWKYSI
ncbi:MAG: lysophospholipid acyltransferase family protein [Ignavibacteriae bacterium]|nr:lysophospholipid acyltransferase family protein [Ignavibacteriota bacterium]